MMACNKHSKRDKERQRARDLLCSRRANRAHRTQISSRHLPATLPNNLPIPAFNAITGSPLNQGNSNATNTAHPSPFRRQHQAPNQNIDRQPMAKQAKSAEEIFTACLAERIARLEEENNKLGVKLEAVTKLALEMARRSGEVELIREFSIAVGDV